MRPCFWSWFRSIRSILNSFRKKLIRHHAGLRTLNLNRANRDRFFQLMENHDLEVEFGDGSHFTVKVKQDCMRFPVRICRAGRDGIAVSVDQELFGISGERGWYVGNETSLVCLDGDRVPELGVFLEQVLKDKRAILWTFRTVTFHCFTSVCCRRFFPTRSLPFTMWIWKATGRRS